MRAIAGTAMLIWVFGSALTVCAGGEPQMVMHRQLVSVKDRDGWYPAKSTEGGYSVLMPLPFSDFSVVGERTDGSSFKMHVLVGKTVDGVKFTVTSGKWTAPRPKFEALYEDFKKSGQKISPVTYTTIAGLQHQRFEVKRETTGAYVCHVMSETELFSFIVEFPEGLRKVVEPLVQKFFDSFQPPQTTSSQAGPSSGA